MSSLDRVRATILTCASLLALGACGEADRPADRENAPPAGGTVLIALIGEPKTLLPALMASEHEQAIVEVLYDRLADIGPSLDVTDLDRFTPRLARSWSWSADSMSIAFALDARLRWHDGQPLVAHDVVRTFALYTDPRVPTRSASLLTNIDSVTAPDSATAVFWFKRRAPQQLYDAAHHMFIMPAHRLTDADPAALGATPLARSRFQRWSTDGRIELIADTANVRGRPALDRVIYELVPEAGAAMVKLLTGESDFAAPLLAQVMDQVSASETVRPLVYPSLRYQLLTFNLRARRGSASPHRVLGDASVRRALTMATNVPRIVRTVFDSLGEPALGPVPRLALPDTNALTPIAYAPAAARALLDSAN